MLYPPRPTPPPPPQPPPPRLPGLQQERRINPVPILITMACGVVLALGSCFGMVGTFNPNHTTPGGRLFGYGIVAGGALFLFGIVWGIFALIIFAFYRISERKQDP